MPYTGNYGKYRGGMATADPYVPENLIAFETRTSEDGEVWTAAWTPVLNGADISSTPARYLQYQATLNLGLGGRSPGLKSVTINYNTNTAPVADADSYGTNEDTPLSISAPGVLVNDTDVDANPLTAILVAGPSYGILALNADGSFTYTPNGNYNGSDSFTYKANDGSVDSAPATVTITITPVNDAPVAVADSYITNEDTPLSISASGVLGNDSDVDSAVFSAVKVTDPTNGSLTLNANGSFTYTPNPNFYGADSFTYKANDGSVDSAPATVTITITAVNDAPVANAQSVPTDEDIPVGITLTASDVDSGSLTYAIVTPPGHGILSGTAPILTYTPASNYHGSDSFSFKANDGSVDSAPATVTITITPVNDAPTITVSTATQTVQYSDNIPTITITATDIDSTSLTATQTGLPVDLTLSDADCLLDGTGGVSCTWTIQGTANVPEDDDDYLVTITVDDGVVGGSATAEITIIVEPEDAAVAFDDDKLVAVQVASPEGNSGSFSLTVFVVEALPDDPEGLAAAGAIDNAVVSMSLQPVGPGPSIIGTCTPDLVVGTEYDAALPVTCAFSDVPVNTYIVQVTVNGGYYTGGGEDVLVVYDPSLGFATGGGWFYWPGTAIGDPTSLDFYPGDRTNFGFTMKYNKKGQNVQGSLLMIRHLSDGTILDGTICGGDPIYNTIYRVKSNALNGLALGESSNDDGQDFGWASFGGKSTYLGPCMPEPKGSNEFIVYVEDQNEPGNGIDRFWIRIKDKYGDLLSLGDLAIDNARKIERGNIVVPHRAR